MKYYRIKVELKNGFTYSYSCIGKMLEGMKKSSESYWTKSIEVVEITEEEHRGPYIFVEEPEHTKAPTATKKKVRAKKSDKSEKPVKLEQKKKTPKKPKGDLEDFL